MVLHCTVVCNMIFLIEFNFWTVHSCFSVKFGQDELNFLLCTTVLNIFLTPIFFVFIYNYVFAAYTAVIDHTAMILASFPEALWFDGLIMTILHTYRNMILLLCIGVSYTTMTCGIIIFQIFVTTNFKIWL